MLYGRSLGSLCLLLLRCLVLPRLPTTGHGAYYGTDGCPLACVAGNGPYRCSPGCSACRTANPLTAARCGT